MDTTARPLRSAGLVGAGLLAGLLLAGLATADAYAPPTPAPVVSGARAGAPSERPDRPRADERDKPDRERAGKPDKGHPLGRVLHGEATVRKPGGGYQVIAAQRGVVTALTDALLTVRSEDGYVRTYVRDERTRVADGVVTGSEVRVLAAVENGVARAVHVRPAPPREQR